MNTQDINRRIRLVMDLRSKGVTDTNVLSAMERVPRDVFVPAAVRDQAWDDMALPIGRGQTISQPYVVASMSAALSLGDRDKVLEIGTGCGYQTAILSKLCRRVYTIERHEIFVTAAAREKPPVALLDQLKVGGAMIIPVGESGEQILKLYRKDAVESYSVRDVMPVRFVPLLPDIAPDCVEEPAGEEAFA
jgi:protein-L-isoaspartate(D-aspartate) O-methyltransferase